MKYWGIYWDVGRGMNSIPFSSVGKFQIVFSLLCYRNRIYMGKLDHMVCIWGVGRLKDCVKGGPCD